MGCIPASGPGLINYTISGYEQLILTGVLPRCILGIRMAPGEANIFLRKAMSPEKRKIMEMFYCGEI